MGSRNIVKEKAMAHWGAVVPEGRGGREGKQMEFVYLTFIYKINYIVM
jgi:hypothetical protein